MKNAKTKLLAIVCIVVLCFSFTGCNGKDKKDETTGTYTAETAEDEAYLPTLSLFDDDTYQFNLSMGSYFKGTYTKEDDKVELTLTENASKAADEDVKTITLDFNEKELQLTLEQDIKGFLKSGTVFNR